MTATENDFSLKHLGSCAELRLTHGIKQLFILKTCVSASHTSAEHDCRSVKARLSV